MHTLVSHEAWGRDRWTHTVRFATLLLAFALLGDGVSQRGIYPPTFTQRRDNSGLPCKRGAANEFSHPRWKDTCASNRATSMAFSPRIHAPRITLFLILGRRRFRLSIHAHGILTHRFARGRAKRLDHPLLCHRGGRFVARVVRASTLNRNPTFWSETWRRR